MSVLVSYFDAHAVYPFIPLFCIYIQSWCYVHEISARCVVGVGANTHSVYFRNNKHVSEMVIIRRRFGRIYLFPCYCSVFNVLLRAVSFCGLFWVIFYTNSNKAPVNVTQFVAVIGCICLFLLVVSALKNICVCT